MKVFVVRATHFDWDEFNSVVVTALDEEGAIALAKQARHTIETKKGDDIDAGLIFKEEQYPLKATEIDLDKPKLVHKSFIAG